MTTNNTPDPLEAAAREIACTCNKWTVNNGLGHHETECDSATAAISALARQEYERGQAEAEQAFEMGVNMSADIYGRWPSGSSKSWKQHVHDEWAALAQTNNQPGGDNDTTM